MLRKDTSNHIVSNLGDRGKKSRRGGEGQSAIGSKEKKGKGNARDEEGLKEKPREGKELGHILIREIGLRGSSQKKNWY